MNPDQVSDRDSFLKFLSVMRAELRAGGADWENVDLPAFLEAMAAWAEAWPRPFSDNPWRHAAVLLHVGAIYE